jgi:hypothetical protein|tara:strand:+ start:678 stop:1145 length:468 start_codon:yes stop_codon:yes gene_type:complete
MKNIIFTILLILTSNSNAEEFLLTDEKAIGKLQEFFELLNIQVYDKENLSKIVTPDFHIFESGNDFDIDSFDSFIDEASEVLNETSWELSDFVVSIDNNSAHVSYLNKGLFKTKQNELVHSEWLESVYMVLDDGELKLKFLQSDLVNEVIEAIDQ